jgi:hypothetical protein
MSYSLHLLTMSKQKGKFRFKTLTAQELANQHLNGSPDLRK